MYVCMYICMYVYIKYTQKKNLDKLIAFMTRRPGLKVNGFSYCMVCFVPPIFEYGSGFRPSILNKIQIIKRGCKFSN